ncbi:MAG: triphosphoribosyl-dephospho-CoA synthetase, partial [Fuerstiella sp.]|nr:triphosphoribosyl-dephospho-CoA synthetase [Fuerstiella sp.]
QHGDSLVLRKCGPTTDERIRRLAAGVLESGWPHAAGSSTVFSEFDSFLRGDGHQRNPGTTADMIAAIVFAALRDGYCQMTSAGLEFWEPEHD